MPGVTKRGRPPAEAARFALGEYGADLAAGRDWAVLLPGTGAPVVFGYTGHRLRTLTAHEHGNCRVVLSPDGARLATGGQDGRVRLYETAGFTELAAPEVGRGFVDTLAFSPDGSVLAAAAGRTPALFNGRDGTSLAPLDKTPGSTLAMAWHPLLPALVVVGNGFIRLLDAAAHTSRDITGRRPYTSAAFSPDGAWLAAGAMDAAVRLIEFGGGEPLEMGGYAGKVRRIVWTTDGHFLATDGAQDLIVWEWIDGAPPEGREPRVFEFHGDMIADLDVRPGTHTIASGALDGSLCVWDATAPGAPPGVVSGKSPVTCVRFSPDGRVLVTSRASGETAVYRL